MGWEWYCAKFWSSILHYTKYESGLQIMRGGGGGGGGVYGQNICYHVAVFVIPFNLMTMF